jgi:DNA-binding helix-hairpin-helix protein with protein kinase domain
MSGLIDDQGRAVLVAGEIAEPGGEGRILEVRGRPDLAAKLYHSGVAEPDKLRAMIAAKSDALLEIAAWPVSTLRERAEGPPVGFLMPRFVGCEEIHSFYSPDNRLRLYPDAHWQTLARAAANLAAAFRVVHERGFVVGDVNQKNILIDATQAVRFVDCDSFQVRANGRVYRCAVGVPEFTPPELQGRNLRETDRRKNHDLFGLAVMIFLLLFANRHPYGNGGNSNRFVYTRHNARRRSFAPPGALSLDAVPFSLAQLFERAFAPPGRAARPTAAEWQSALVDFHNQLVPCRRVRTHYYHTVAGSCPWCQLEARYAVRLFRHARAWNLVEHIRLPSWDDVLFAISVVVLGVGILATVPRRSAVVPFRNDGASRRVPVVESQEETTKRILVESIAGLARSNDGPDVLRSLRALSDLGPAAEPAIPALIERLIQDEYGCGKFSWGDP